MADPQKIISLVEILNQDYDAEEEKKRNTLGRRIRLSRKCSDITLSTLRKKLAEKGVRVTESSISKWECGETIPNAYQLIAVQHILDLADSLQGFTSHHKPLLNADGYRMVIDYANTLIATRQFEPDSEPEDMIDVPVSVLRASAGTGQFLDSECFEKQSFRESDVPYYTDFGLYVSGDSMEPVHADGDLVFIHKQETLNIGEVGVFCLDGDGYIKVYNEETLTDGSRCPVLFSYNCRYAPIHVRPDQSFSILGKVL